MNKWELKIKRSLEYNKLIFLTIEFNIMLEYIISSSLISQRIVNSANFCELCAVVFEKTILRIHIPISILILFIVSWNKPWVSINVICGLQSWDDFLVLKWLMWISPGSFHNHLIYTLTKSMISFSSWVQHFANSVSQIFLPYLWR